MSDACRCAFAGGSEETVCEGLLARDAAPDGADGQVHMLVGPAHACNSFAPMRALVFGMGGCSQDVPT